MNALRPLLYEHGHVFPAGIRHLSRMTALVEDEASDLPALIREERHDLLAQIAEKTTRITERTTKLKTLASQSDRARRLQTMPGVGPLTAIAVEAFGPDMAQFKTGRDFAAWLGLVLQTKCIEMRFGNVDANGMLCHLRQSYSCHAWLKHAYPFRPLVKTTVDQTHTRSL